mgnify:FL=1
MSDSFRSRLIRVAYANPTLQKQVLPLLKVAIDFDSQHARDEYVRTHKVRPDTQLTVKAPESKTSPDTAGKSEHHKMPKVPLKADRYKDGKCKFTGYPEFMSQHLKDAFGKKKPLTPEHIADLMGVPALLSDADSKYTVNIVDADIVVMGPHIEIMDRTLKVDDDGHPYIYNETLMMKKGAPKGLGTKIFGNQVAQAKESGVKYLKCNAHRDRIAPSWVGYKVWPKLGYDGPIPFTPGSRPNGYTDTISAQSHADFTTNMEPKLKAAGFKAPYQVSHLYMVEGGQDWWEEHGESFNAKFDLSDDSHSMRVFTAYLAEKAKQDNTTPEEWLSKMAADKKPDPKNSKPSDKKSKGHENVELDAADHKALDAVWKKLRK